MPGVNAPRKAKSANRTWDIWLVGIKTAVYRSVNELLKIDDRNVAVACDKAFKSQHA